ncbi:YpoC family protein [Metaplanococcus flavidus]|uniref:YpoC family protein n=1 Tax=Metaplanococcus flavidus TaxID=569883 RepID=A0ABW3L8L9_9BACL
MNKLLKSIEKEKIEPYYSDWNVLEAEIREIFSARKLYAEASMNKGINLYKALLNQCSTKDESVVPLNHAERLEFIEANRSTYAAFRQLSELFKELDKKIASKRAILRKLE